MYATTWMLAYAVSACPMLLPPPFINASVGISQHSQNTLAASSSEVSRATEVLTTAPQSSLSFDFKAGRLRPQLEQLLMQFGGVQHVQWLAPEGLLWPSDYTLTGISYQHMLEAVLKSYQLRLTLYANHTAVVQPVAGDGL